MTVAQEAPRYQLITPAYIDDQYLPEDEVIEVDEDFIPNEGMIPLNKPAIAAFERFMETVNGGTPDLGDVVEAGMRKRPRYEPQVPEPKKTVSMPNRKPSTPMTGYDPNTQQMTAPKPSKTRSVGQASAGSGKAVRVMGTVNQTTPRGI